MLNYFHVAWNTFRESLREPIFFLLLTTAAALIGLFPSLSLFVFREQIKLVVDSAMATTMVFGLFAAVISASHTITREMRNGTALILLSKPVPRWKFILAKISGILAALTLFVYICNSASLISLHIAKDQFRLDLLTMYIYYGLISASFLYGALRNFYSRKSFSSEAAYALFVLFTAYVCFLYARPVQGSEDFLPLNLVIRALALIFFAVWAMGAISVMLSIRLNIVSNLIVCTLIFLAGLVSDYFLGRHAETSIIYSVFYAIVPNFQLFWLADSLAAKRLIPVRYLVWGGIYAFMYISLCSSIAIVLFRDREIAGDLV